MNQATLKQAAAQAALDQIQSKITPDSVIGIGTGSTVNYFMDCLATIKADIHCTVASSEASAQRLKQHGIPVEDLNNVSQVTWYIDGADEVNAHLELIKGGGGALTREKILAAVADEFICIADQSKWVKHLGNFPLPIEVIPMARSYVAREIVKLGGDPVYRQGFVTDNGHIILDVHHFPITQPHTTEQTLNNIAGVVSNGIFAKRSADVLLLSSDDKGVQVIYAE